MVPHETSLLSACQTELQRSPPDSQHVPEAQSIAVTFPSHTATPELPTLLLLLSITPALSSFFRHVTHHSVTPSSPCVAQRALGTMGSQPVASPSSRCQLQLPYPNPVSGYRQR